MLIVDESDDGGSILIQSASLPLSRWDNELRDVRRFAERKEVTTLITFKEAAQKERSNLYQSLEKVSAEIQNELKVKLSALKGGAFRQGSFIVLCPLTPP